MDQIIKAPDPGCLTDPFTEISLNLRQNSRDPGISYVFQYDGYRSGSRRPINYGSVTGSRYTTLVFSSIGTLFLFLTMTVPPVFLVKEPTRILYFAELCPPPILLIALSEARV